MDSYKSRKLSLAIFISILVLMGTQVNAAQSKPLPAASTSVIRNTCKSVDGLAPMLKRGNVLLFGEMHGTQEIPAFIADVVCMAVKRRIPVTVGLEIPFDEQEAINRFLDSKGDLVVRDRLTKGAFWHRKFEDGRNYTDGRTSMAILQLVEQIRFLRASGAKLRIVAYDSKPGVSDRDRVMSQNLAAAISHKPKNLFVVLSGDVHNRLTRGNPWNKEFESMAYLLTKSISTSRLISFVASHEGGKAWLCAELSSDSKQTCQPLTLRPRAGATAWTVKLTAEPNAPFNGTFGVGSITASPPVHQ